MGDVSQCYIYHTSYYTNFVTLKPIREDHTNLYNNGKVSVRLCITNYKASNISAVSSQNLKL